MLGFRLNKMGVSGRGNKPILDEWFSDSSKSLDPRITFTRASSAMYCDSNGIWQTVGNDVPRAHANQHHDFTTLEPQGFWIESARTNSALYCRDFTQGVWAKTNMTATLTATGIDGAANSASVITATAGNATILQTLTSASADRVQSCFVKRRTGTGNVQMTMDNGTTWTTITVTSAWTRVRIPLQTVTNPVMGFRLVTSGDAIDVDYFQHESGVASDMVSSPILTTTTSATRASDDCVITGATFSTFYNATEGTFLIEARQAEPSASSSAWCVTSGASTNAILMLMNVSTGVISFQIETSGATQVNLTAKSGYTGTSFVTWAGAYQVNNCQTAADGIASSVDTLATLPAVTRMHIGRTSATASTNRFNGFLRRIAYYRTRLPEATLASITA